MSNPKSSRWVSVFLEFAKDLRINSKEAPSEDGNGVPLELWDSQKRFLNELGTGLDSGIRKFNFLKSRQLGITTVSLVIDVFWLAFYPGTRAALICDSEKNAEANRATIKGYINSMPSGYFGDDFFIVKGGDNRRGLKFSNNSVLDILVAGTKRKSTAWGEGQGYVMSHQTEVASYGDAEGLASFEESLAQSHPNRLLIRESTGKGFNHWRTLYMQGLEDPLTTRSVFIGWFCNPHNAIPKSDPRFLRYGQSAASGEERELVTAVAKLYGHKITREQLAWIRYKEFNAGNETDIFRQNQPWTAQQAFVLTGYSFFQVRAITQEMKKIMDGGDDYGYKPYYYELGNDFFDMKLIPIEDLQADRDKVELKVWEEPVEGGQYVLGFDPAYGRNEHKDSHGISIWRCFADKIVQVAEYATADVETKHAAWVCAHLAGAYGDIVVNPELGGPGKIVINEWDHIRGLMQSEYKSSTVKARDWENALGNARWYLYSRQDSIKGGMNYGFECLALDTKLPTTNGWTTMADVKEGDSLLSDVGDVTKVIGCSDIKYNSKCYKICFDDGTVIVADENHWWKIMNPHWPSGSSKMKQTRELVAGKHNIRKAPPLDLPDRELPIDPYLLGVWLGDGTSSGASVSCGDEDVDEMSSNIISCGQKITLHRYKTCWRIGLNNGKNGSRGNDLIKKLNSLCLINNKHVPDIYLRASFSQRLSLMQGIMDTDGTAMADRGGHCGFSTSSDAIRDGFAELIRSLGFKAKFMIKKDNRFPDGKSQYQFWFTAYPEMPVFRLARKANRLGDAGRKTRNCHHRILSIKEVPSVPVRCIMVDSKNCMYLAGDGMIPTHNTTYRTKQEIMFQFRGAFVTHELIIRSIRLLEEMRIVVQDGASIGAPESSSPDQKDDRVIAAALALRAWIDWRRPDLLAQGLTYERVTSEEDGTATALQRSVNGLVYRYLKSKQEEESLEVDPRPAWLVDRGLL